MDQATASKKTTMNTKNSNRAVAVSRFVDLWHRRHKRYPSAGKVAEWLRKELDIIRRYSPPSKPNVSDQTPAALDSAMRQGASSRLSASVLFGLLWIMALVSWGCPVLGKRTGKHYTISRLQHSSCGQSLRLPGTSGKWPLQSSGQCSDRHAHQRETSSSVASLHAC